MYQEKTHDSDPDTWFIFNLHREFLFILHTQTIKSGCVFLLKKEERKTEKYPYLEGRSPVHGGEFPSSQVPCLKSTAFAPLALPSPTAPASRQKTFIYIQTTLKCLLLLLGIRINSSRQRNKLLQVAEQTPPGSRTNSSS